MGFVTSFRKNLRLTNIMRRLGDHERNIGQMMSRTSSGATAPLDFERAEEELYDLIENDPDLKAIMRQYGATRQTLRDIYRKLLDVGLGQWVGSTHLASAALATNPTLRFILHETQANPSRIDRGIGARLLKYYMDGSLGPVK